jgi:hypothetical protein
MSTRSTFPSDGLLPTGSYDITFLELPLELYTADNFQWDQETNFDGSRTFATGKPKSSKVIDGHINGSMDLQLADEDTALPRINHTFVIGDHGYYVTGRGTTRTANDEIKLRVSIRRCVNPLISYHADQALTEDVAITAIAPSATGPESGLSYTWAATGLPTGVTINASTGEITGTPTAVETTTATITATTTNEDGETVKGVRIIKFTVTAAST